MSIPLRLLIVEDTRSDAELVQHVLRHGGYEVACQVVDNAAAMRAALERQEWDAITSDHRMPGFSAPLALALARELRPGTPFIIVSGEIDLDLAVSMIKDGAQDYVQKQDLQRVVPAIERALKDATARREREAALQALEASEARYRRLFEASRDGILIVNADSGQVIDANPSLMQMSGYPRFEFVGRKMWEINAFLDKDTSMTVFGELRQLGFARHENLRFRTREGRPLDVDLVSNVYTVGQTRMIQANIRDITGRQSERLLQQVPNYDGLTGLPNRMLFYDRLAQAIRVAQREREELSLLYLDLDHFEYLNATVGEGTGATILKGAADRILKQVRNSDTVARIGDEQFAVILPKVATPQNAVTVARKLIEALLPDLKAAGAEAADIAAGPSIGIAIFPTFAADQEALLRAADAAMYKAKQRGQGFSFGTA
jgi:diguanylate cyclase (GGDEF)-like protein/PAS domain S-box-containing protein